MFLIEASNKEISFEDKEALGKIKEVEKPCILVINKKDLVKKERLLDIIAMYKDEYVCFKK